MKGNLIRFILGILPAMLMITLLLTFFPNTGLGRIIYLPFILLLNSLIIIVVQVSTKNLNHKIFRVVWTITITLTMILTIAFYPQDYGPHVISKILLYILVDYHHVSIPYVITVILLALCYFGWKVLSKKVKKADSAEEIRQIYIPVILFAILTVIIFISFFI